MKRRISKPIIIYYLRRTYQVIQQQFSKILYWGIGSIIIFILGWVINLKYYKPYSVELFFERMFYEQVRLHPELLTETRAFDKVMLDDYKWKLDHYSVDQIKLDSQLIQNQLEMLQGYRTFLMTEDERRSINTFRFVTEEKLTRSLLFSHLHFPVNHINGIQVKLPFLMVNSHSIDNLSDARAYISRLQEVENKISELISGKELYPTKEHDEQNTTGFLHRREHESLEEAIDLFLFKEQISIPPKNILNRVERQIDLLLWGEVEQNLFYRDFVKKLKRIKGEVPESVQGELLYDLKLAIEEGVIPAFNALKRCIDKMKSISPDEITLYQYPLGDMYYQHLLTKHLGTDQQTIDLTLTPDSLYRKAEEEVAFRQEKMRHLLIQFFDDPDSSSFEELFERYQQLNKTTPKSPFTRLSIEMIKQRAHAERFHKEKVGNLISFPGIYLTLPHLGEAMYEPFYKPSSFDKGRKGNLYLPNVDVQKSLENYYPMLWNILYLVSGEHYQKSIQRSQSHLPSFQKITKFTYFSEGWKYYVLNKATEYKGFHEFDLQIGFQYEMLKKATRAICDIGVHNRLWNLDEALSYYQQHTLSSREQATYALDIVTVAPAWSVAYLVGMNAFQRFYEKTKALKGKDFNNHNFHYYILSHGEVPLSELTEIVRQYNSNMSQLAND